MIIENLRKLKTNLGLLVLGVLLAFFGCTVYHELSPAGAGRFPFSHDVHVTKLGQDCESCHPGCRESNDAGMPKLAACKTCHRGAEQYAKYIEPFVRDGRLSLSTVTNVPEDVIFSHKLHSGKGINCESCHRGITGSGAITAELKVSKDDCLSCHGKANLSSECQICHKVINREWAPPSHARGWERAHGYAVRESRDFPSEYRCKMCHLDSECQSCHQTQQPRDHTNFFRRRGHGIAAGMDRRRCLTCHKTDLCTSCHESNAPRTHTGSFGSPRSRHCLMCHFPLSGQSCFVCHKTDSSHRAQAAPIPNDGRHRGVGDEQCRSCHSPYMKHPDPGEQCRRCHI
ncbi:cytochrome c3 family protein [bacterium]|nr:cytochrome c3 family protein [bacterium]